MLELYLSLAAGWLTVLTFVLSMCCVAAAGDRVLAAA
jgi:hypothetical protein